MKRSAQAAQPAVDPILSQALGPDAAQLPPELAARLSEVLSAASTAPANQPVGAAGELPPFFRNMERMRFGESSMGGEWKEGGFPAGTAYRLSAVDQALAGIDGIAFVLHANCAAQFEAPEQTIPGNVVDRLFYGLRQLAEHARNELEGARP